MYILKTLLNLIWKFKDPLFKICLRKANKTTNALTKENVHANPYLTYMQKLNEIEENEGYHFPKFLQCNVSI